MLKEKMSSYLGCLFVQGEPSLEQLIRIVDSKRDQSVPQTFGFSFLSTKANRVVGDWRKTARKDRIECGVEFEERSERARCQRS
jgi:hypothetical protein